MKHDMHYRTPFWKLALGGVAAGAILYFFPFLLPALAFFFLTGLLLRMFFGSGRWGGHGMHLRYAYAEHWQSMTEEQREAMRAKFRKHRCGQWQGPSETTRSTPNANA